jgi:hypothetical protein
MAEMEEQEVKYPEGDGGLLPVFNAILASCEANREPHDRVAEDIENLIANEYNFKGKAEWQSKVPLPTFASNREKFAAVMQKGMIQAQTFFATTAKPWSPYAGFSQSVHDWVDFRLNRLKFKTKFTEGCKIAASRARMWFKPHYAAELRQVLVWPKDEQPVLDGEGNPTFDPMTGQPVTTITVGEPVWETRAEFKLQLPMVHPKHIWRDPTGRDRFVIHEYTTDYGELLALAEEGHYDKAAVLQLSPADNSEDEAEEQAERSRHDEGDPGSPSTDKGITMHEFWGDLYDNEGRLVEKNCTFTVANKQVFVRKPIKNPYWHGKKPFASGAPVVDPMSIYDKSFLKDAREIQRAQTEYINLTLDAAKLAVAPPTTLDIEQALDVNDYKRGMYPGCVIKVRGSWSNGQAPLNTMRLSPIDPMTVSVSAMLDRENQKSTGVTDLMQGLMPMRRETASGGAMRLGESASLFDTYARNLEEQLIGDMVEQVWALDLQYFDWTDPCARDIMGEEFAAVLANMTPEERYRLIEHFEFRGEGLSTVLSKEQEIQKVDMFMSRLGRYPMLGQRANIDFFIEKAVEAMGWNPKKALMPPGQNNPIPGKEPPGAIPQTPTPQQQQAGGSPQGGPSAMPPQLMQLLASPQGQAIMAQLMGGGQ